MNVFGIGVQGEMAADDRIVPSLRCKSHNRVFPDLGKANFVAPNSTIIGKVNIGQDSSIWYGTTIRGDLNQVTVGKGSVIQDLATLHPNQEKSIEIGDNVYVGPNSVLESCTIQNNGFVGMGASVHQGSKIESYGIVAAGAVISENTTVPSYQIWAGNPAKYLRDLSNEEKTALDEFHSEMQSLAKVHAEEAEKTFREIIDDKDLKVEQDHYDPEDWALQRAKELGFPMEADDEDFMEQRIFMREHEPSEEQHWKKNYDPYEQDLFHFPDSFKIYGENFDRYEDLKKYFQENPNVQASQIERKERVPPKSDKAWTRKF
jgi:carbonic anhydrase/acetyltransferase-like protein (isoleucine patch superfamily)